MNDNSTQVLERLRRLRDLRAELERQETRPFLEYIDNPRGFITDVLHDFMWSKQLEIAESVRDNRATAVPSAHDMGKSFIAARVAAWWLSCHPVGEARVVTTAPTGYQVRAILWQEIIRAHRAGKLPGRLTQTTWWFGDELVGMGRKPSDYDPDAFQGIHARYVLVILDEACGIPTSLWNAADSLVTNEASRMLAIGNPDDPTSEFAKMCRANSGWHVIPIDGLDSPNFTDEDVPPDVADLLLSRTWVDERRRRWGEDSPLFIAKVRGRFPDVTEGVLIPLSWVERARERSLPAKGDTVLGVDVARGGGDETVIMRRRGRVARIVHSDAVNDTMQTAGHVFKLLRDEGASEARIDVVGIGAGVFDRLRELRAPVVAMGGGTRPIDTERFVNARAEWYWNLREAFDPSAAPEDSIDIDPDDEILAEQLPLIKFDLDSRGRVRVEGKDEMRRRGQPSPDRADALMYAFNAPPVEISGVLEEDTRDDFSISPV